MHKFFIAGTDTDVGKTYVSCKILEAAAAQGMSTLGLKPVSAGCELVEGQYQNEDAQALITHSSLKLPYTQVNPVALLDACSPHIAAANAGKAVSASRVVGYCNGALMQRPDFALVEGAGGWRVPISPRETMADIAKQLGFPVILVVGLKLGCLSHALLTAEAIRRDGLTIAGWVGNQVEPTAMAFFEENVATLNSALGVPNIGVLPYDGQVCEPSQSNEIQLDCLTV